MKRYVLEVCVDSVESAIAAKNGGATRLELCSNLVIGGTTPSIELYEMVKEETGLPVHVLIRPRFGDFLYSDAEYDLMCRQIRTFVKAGADAVVTGSLRADGTLNEEQMRGLLLAAGSAKMVLHRAFDMTKDPMEALETARNMGVCAILTSGQEADCFEGRVLIGRLLEASGEMEILIGAGVNADMIEKMCAILPATCFHMSGKKILQSGMEYRNKRVFMGISGMNEYEIYRTDTAEVARAVDALEKNLRKFE